MALEIRWTKRALIGLDKVIGYLEEEWTINEILQLEDRIFQLEKIISSSPYGFPIINTSKSLRKGLVDKNNYIVYRVNDTDKIIDIINFRGTQQRPIY